MSAAEPTPGAPQGGRRRSLLGRLVTVIGLAFVVVELTLLLVFTQLTWSRLRDLRQEHLGRYAAAVHEPVRRALDRGVPNEQEVDAALKRALEGGPEAAARAEALAPRFSPPAGAEVRVWVFTPREVYRFTREGELLRGDAAGWSGARPASIETFLEGGGQLASHVEQEEQRIVRCEPLSSGIEGAGSEAVLYCETSLEDVLRQVATYGAVAFGTGALAILATAMITLGYLRWALLLPLARIVRADNAARRGDTEGGLVDEAEIPDDEVGEIMRSRNHLHRAMIQTQLELDRKNSELEAQREELRAWGRELEGLIKDKSQALLRARDTIHSTEKLAAVGRLAANVAHEINNPLACIVGYAEAAREDLELGDLEQVKSALGTVEDAAFRCKDILKRLLGLARSELQESEPVLLGELARESLALSKSKAERREVELRHELEGSGPELNSDAGALQQVILNLVDNAIDAAASGDAPHWVRVRLERTPREVRLEVADSGRGIPDETLARVFDPFYTTKPVGRGTGLGLAICQSLIDRLGGRITCHPGAGTGAVFVIHLPLPPGQSHDGSELVEAHLADLGAGGSDPSEESPAE